MKVSLSWLKELVKYDSSDKALAEKLSLTSVGVKSQTQDYLELDLTYNRSDLLSMRGVAREVAAITDSKVTFEDQPSPKYDLPETPVRIENEKLCPLYIAAKVENLQVEQSDDSWVKKLFDSGIRSVNNVADVTNLIMLEFGQPMHAFDARGIKDESILVRTAKKGEGITTLDGKTRDINPNDLLIADSQSPLALAGVMGGKDSEINDSTSTILLEAAIFDPVSVRNTSKTQGLVSESSKRFQHGLTKTNLLQALSAAIKMYEGLGGKLVAINMVGDLEEKPKIVNLNYQRLNDLIGIEIPKKEVESSLNKLCFELASHSSSGNVVWEVKVPYWRLDISIEEDLVEEVTRMYGYDKIEGKPLEGKQPEKLDESLQNMIHDLKLKLKDLGLTEVQTYSFYSTNVLEALGFTEQYKKFLIKVANPISAETEYLRLNLWPNLVEVVGRNMRQGFKDIGIFEIGKSYHVSFEGSGQSEEGYALSIALYNNSDNPLEELVSIAKKLDLEIDMDNSPAPEVVTNLFHPKRFVHIKKDGKEIGGMAEVHLRVLNKLGIEKRVAVLEIELMI